MMRGLMRLGMGLVVILALSAMVVSSATAAKKPKGPVTLTEEGGAKAVPTGSAVIIVLTGDEELAEEPGEEPVCSLNANGTVASNSAKKDVVTAGTTFAHFCETPNLSITQGTITSVTITEAQKVMLKLKPALSITNKKTGCTYEYKKVAASLEPTFLHFSAYVPGQPTFSSPQKCKEFQHNTLFRGSLVKVNGGTPEALRWHL